MICQKYEFLDAEWCDVFWFYKSSVVHMFWCFVIYGIIFS